MKGSMAGWIGSRHRMLIVGFTISSRLIALFKDDYVVTSSGSSRSTDRLGLGDDHLGRSRRGPRAPMDRRGRAGSRSSSSNFFAQLGFRQQPVPLWR
jgi:hypothetical protein